jgi:hypothetical protein
MHITYGLSYLASNVQILYDRHDIAKLYHTFLSISHVLLVSPVLSSNEGIDYGLRTSPLSITI